MTLLDELKRFSDLFKRYFSSKIINQIPDSDRVDSYRYDELTKQWVLLNPMTDIEQPILDANRRLLVDTPNNAEFIIEATGAPGIEAFNFIVLDFLADSVTISISKIVQESPRIRLWYYDDANNETIGSVIYDKAAGEATNFIEQTDLIPFKIFRFSYLFGNGSSSRTLIKMLFSKQKKTKISDTAYNATSFNGIIDIAPSKNVLRDWIEAHLVPTIHHTATVAGDLSHNSLANLNAGTVYEHISAAQVAALHAAVVAGDLSHNSLANLNAGTVYEHISAAQVAALHTILDGYTKAEIQEINAIGSGNKRWSPIILAGSSSASTYAYKNTPYFSNIGGTNYSLSFDIPLPPQIVVEGTTYNLVITQNRIGIVISDSSDYVDITRYYGITTDNPPVLSAALAQVDHDSVHGIAAGLFTNDHADITVGGVYNRFLFYVVVEATTVNQIAIGYCQVEYYYVST